jgi:hypothetical protein
LVVLLATMIKGHLMMPQWKIMLQM